MRFFAALGLVVLWKCSLVEIRAHTIPPTTYNVSASEIEESREALEEAQLNITETDKGPSCSSSSVVSGNSGEFTSPNYPEKYPNNVTCIWKIRARKDRYTYLFFHAFELEAGYVSSAFNPFAKPECHFDMLYIAEEYTEPENAEGESEQVISADESKTKLTHVSWGMFCGSDTPPPRMTKKAGSTIVIVFHSDISKAKTGFHASFHSLKSKNTNKNVDSRVAATSKSVSGVLDAVWAIGSDESLRAYLAIIVFVSAVIAVIATAHCYTGRSYCNGITPWRQRTRNSRSIPSIMLNMFGGSGISRTPTPPPAYGEIVKTDEDWHEALRRMGETNESMERYRSRPDNIQIAYDLAETSSPRPTGASGASPQSPFRQRALPMIGQITDPRGGVSDILLDEITNGETVVSHERIQQRNTEF